jgi:hypothetical protein
MKERYDFRQCGKEMVGVVCGDRVTLDGEEKIHKHERLSRLSRTTLSIDRGR